MQKFLSHKGRSVWKGFFLKKKILKHTRAVVINKALVGLIIKVYNGRSFFNFNILSKHIGYKLGQFVFTRVYRSKFLRKKIKKNKK